MSDVPPEILTDVFSHLPVKSLLRFRCVSKSFCALIDSPNFIKSHLKSNSNRTVIAVYRDIFSINFDSLHKSVILNDSIKTPKSMTRIVGYCNGLFYFLSDDESTVLWNPFTRKHINLPVNKIVFPGDPSTFGICEMIVYGFGHDYVNDDYKVVRIAQFWDEIDGVENEVKVFSLRSNSWRRIKDFPYYLCYKGAHGVLVNGVLHWVVTKDSNPEDQSLLIASFDLGTEDYHLVPQPKYLDLDFQMNVAELGGKLSVYCNYNMIYVDIWVMNSYGVKESWTKSFSVAQSGDISKFEYVRPLAYSEDGEKVLLEQEGEKLIWYDLKSKTVKEIKIPGLPTFWDVYVCMESLVKLTCGATTDVPQEKSKNIKRKTIKKRDDFLSKGFKLVL